MSPEPPKDVPEAKKEARAFDAVCAELWQVVLDHFTWPKRSEGGSFERDQAAAITQLGEEPYASIANGEIPEMLLDATRASGEAKVESLRALDGKALAFAGVAATVVGLFAALGSHGPWTLVGLLPLLLAIICFLLGGFVRKSHPPAPEQYVVLNVLKGDEGMSARLKAALAMAWSGYSIELARTSAFKGFWVRWGALLLVLGLIALIVVTIAVPASVPAPGSH